MAFIILFLNSLRNPKHIPLTSHVSENAETEAYGTQRKLKKASTPAQHVTLTALAFHIDIEICNHFSKRTIKNKNELIKHKRWCESFINFTQMWSQHGR